MTPYDHSITYRRLSIRNIGHIVRLKAILRTIRRLRIPKNAIYFDVGCSNGYITARIAEEIAASHAVGWDHSEAHLAVGAEAYPAVSFRYIDLNKLNHIERQADLVTCFEALEHVGSPETAVENLRAMVAPGGQLFVTVPIEVGPIGVLKYFAKTVVFGYTLDEISSNKHVQRDYCRALIAGRDISQFRTPRHGWATHFGFDYRRMEAMLRQKFRHVEAWTAGTTRFVTGKP